MALLAWEGAYRLFTWPADTFPVPAMLLRAAGVSILRLVAGFGVSLMLGAALGLALWRWRHVNALLGPLFLGLQTLPSVCWVPLAVLLLGASEQAIHFTVVMGSVFAIAVSLRDGLANIPPVYQRAGLMLGARGWRLYRYVLLPASLPALATSLRQGFAFAWRGLMGGEMMFLAVNAHGLGFWLAIQRKADPSGGAGQILSIMSAMVLIGMLADRWVFAPVQHRVHTRFGLAS